MDRLQALILIAALAGCSGEETVTGGSGERVVSVAPRQEGPAEEFCEVTRTAAQAQPLTFPALASGTAPAAGGPRWINVWATWCRPCVEEMPMIVSWGPRLRASGVRVEMVFLSADTSDLAIANFRAQNAGSPESLRVADPHALPAWLTSVGLDEGAPLPIHIFTDAQGKVRCARAAAVSANDYDGIRQLVASFAR